MCKVPWNITGTCWRFLVLTVRHKTLKDTKSYLLPIVYKGQDTEPLVIRKVNQHISFEFGDIKCLYLLNLCGEKTSLEIFLDAIKLSATKTFFCKGFNRPDRMQNAELSFAMIFPN